jgi:flagellar basal body-associated protein FliL
MRLRDVPQTGLDAAHRCVAAYGFVRKGIAMKKLIILIVLIAVAAFAYSKVSGSKSEHEFGA